MLAGGTWSNLDPVVAEQIAEGQAGKKAQARREGAAGNNSSEADPAEILKDQIEAALEGVDAYGKIESDEQAGAAISLRNRLNELKNEADKLREKMVRPHLDAQQAINGSWNPMIKGAEAGGKKLVRLCEDVGDRQARRASQGRGRGCRACTCTRGGRAPAAGRPGRRRS